MAKFTRLNLDDVRSTEGYEAEFKEPDSLLYREAKRRFVDLYTVALVSYFTGQPYSLVYVHHHLAWNSHPKLLTDSDCKRIKRRVHAALKFMGEQHEFR